MRSLVWPGDCPLTQPYGCTDLAVEPYDARCASKHWHCGVDIGMPSGTPLRAARGGWVRQVSYGLLAVSIPGAGQMDWYVHIDTVANAVVVGAKVTHGQVIALSGAKVPQGGSLTGPHLHFEVQSGNLNVPTTSVDPRPILAGVGTVAELPEEWLTQTKSVLDHVYGTAGTNTTPTFTQAQLMAAIKAIQIQNQPVLDAIANLQRDVSQIKLKTDKDLA